ncbi:MAG: chromosome partitioning protein [Treponema sp.]|jgi:phage shock protein A|nr:chromosome partitioning protein [Treponema sp.]
MDIDSSAPEHSSGAIAGMTVPQARELIGAHIIQVKLNEKQCAALEAEAAKWRGRAELARSKNAADLQAEAERLAAAAETKLAALKAETAELAADIKRLFRQLPALAARERSVDPDLLLQELLISAGMNPGEEALLGVERKFAALEKDAAAGAELAALKAKLAGGGNGA